MQAMALIRAIPSCRHWKTLEMFLAISGLKNTRLHSHRLHSDDTLPDAFIAAMHRGLPEKTLIYYPYR